MTEPNYNIANVYLEGSHGWSDIADRGSPNAFSGVYLQDRLNVGVVLPITKKLTGVSSLLLGAEYSSFNGGEKTLGSHWEQITPSVGLNQSYFFNNRVHLYLEGKYGLGHGDGKMNYGLGYLPVAQEGWSHNLSGVVGADYCLNTQVCLGPNVGTTSAWTFDQKTNFHSQVFDLGARITWFWDPLPDRREIVVKTVEDIKAYITDPTLYLSDEQLKGLIARLEVLKARSEKKGDLKQAAYLRLTLINIRKDGLYKKNLPVVQELINHAEYILARDQVFGLPILVPFKEYGTELDIGSSVRRLQKYAQPGSDYSISCYGNSELDYFINSVHALASRITTRKIKNLKINIKIKGYAYNRTAGSEVRNLIQLREQTVREYLQGVFPSNKIADLPTETYIPVDAKVPIARLRGLNPTEKAAFQSKLNAQMASDGFSLPSDNTKVCSAPGIQNGYESLISLQEHPTQDSFPEMDLVNDHSSGNPTANNYEGLFYHHVAVSIEIMRQTDNGEHLVQGDELHELLVNLFGERNEGEAAFRMAP